jgi:hypothetical protein
MSSHFTDATDAAATREAAKAACRRTAARAADDAAQAAARHAAARFAGQAIRAARGIFMSASMSQATAPEPKRRPERPRRESIEKPPPRPERSGDRGRIEDAEPSRGSRDDGFDPNVNSTRT